MSIFQDRKRNNNRENPVIQSNKTKKIKSISWLPTDKRRLFPTVPDAALHQS
jgi:hypothetical protein